jgi:glutathione S-transferase
MEGRTKMNVTRSSRTGSRRKTEDPMTYDLAIGDRSYSSWSLRGWLLFEKFGLPVRCHSGVLYTNDFARLLAEVVGDTLAIAETLAERHPGAGLWPEDPAARAMARWMAAEMHSGFTALRGDCPMNLRVSYQDAAPRAEVLDDLARIDLLWARARDRFGGTAPWLFGRYTAADAFFAPVAARIATYNLPVSAAATGYVAAHLSDAAFRRWRATGLAEDVVQPSYRKPHAERPWPGPAPRPATPAEGPSENAACPYSGRPVTHFLLMEGRVWGFCNAFCRDKTLADPEAWPAFMAMVAR